MYLKWSLCPIICFMILLACSTDNQIKQNDSNRLNKEIVNLNKAQINNSTDYFEYVCSGSYNGVTIEILMTNPEQINKYISNLDINIPILIENKSNIDLEIGNINDVSILKWGDLLINAKISPDSKQTISVGSSGYGNLFVQLANQNEVMYYLMTAQLLNAGIKGMNEQKIKGNLNAKDIKDFKKTVKDLKNTGFINISNVKINVKGQLRENNI